jgi:protein ImuB
MRIPSYDDLTPSIPDVSPGDVFASVARLLPGNDQLPTPDSQILQCGFGSWKLDVGSLFACLRSPGMYEAIGRIAQDFSPRIQRYSPDAVVLDVSGLGRLLGSPHTIGAELARMAAAYPHADIRVAVAPTQIAALLLSLSDSPLSVVSANESAAVSPLALEVLRKVASAVQPASRRAFDNAFDVLQRWGLQRLGEFAALPAGELSARLGQAGVALQLLARGADPRPLVPDPGVPRFVERMELEWPIDGLEPLSFVFARLLDPLSAALERADRAAAAIRLHLRLVDRTTHERALQLPAAIRDPRVLRTLLLLDLESHPPSDAIDIVTIEVDPAPSRIVQYSLLERAIPSAETLATLNARLGALVGEDRCGSPELLETHRPDAFVMRRFDPPPSPLHRFGAASRVPTPGGQPPAPNMRRFRPPVAVRVTVDRGRPVHVAIDRRGMPGGAIVRAAGPWRTSGAWWDREATAWDRDEWDVECADQAVCRLFHDRDTGVWFLDGIFD